MDAFNVYLHGRLLATVFYAKGQETSEGVRRSFVHHDGYNPDIVVRKAGK